MTKCKITLKAEYYDQPFWDKPEDKFETRELSVEKSMHPEYTSTDLIMDTVYDFLKSDSMSDTEVVEVIQVWLSEKLEFLEMEEE